MSIANPSDRPGKQDEGHSFIEENGVSGAPFIVPWRASSHQANEIEADGCSCGCSGTTPK